MGAEVSRPHRCYLARYGPADILQRCCGGARCWCGHRHGHARYYFRDPHCIRPPRHCDPHAHIMMGRGMPGLWRDPSDWTLKDIEIMGGIFNELNDRLERQLMMNGRRGLYRAGVEEMLLGALPPSRGGGSHSMMRRMREISREHSRRLGELEDLAGIAERDIRADVYRRAMQDMISGFVRENARLNGPLPGFGPIMIQNGGGNPYRNFMGGNIDQRFFEQQPHPFRVNGNGIPRHGHRVRSDEEDDYEQDPYEDYYRRSVTTYPTLLTS